MPLQGGDVKLVLNFKPALLLNQFEFYRQKLPEPECSKQLLLKRDGKSPAQKSARD